MDVDLESSPTVRVVGTVGAPLDQVWKLFRPFGDVMKWWNIYEWVKLEQPGKDEPGAVRSFLTKTGRTYEEKLVERDDQKRFERYDMLSVKPGVPTFKGAVTTVQMNALSANQTQVVWSSWSDAGAVLLGQIKATQSEVYQNAIRDLDRHFNPALGKLRATVVSASGLKSEGFLPTNPYALVQLDDGMPQRTKVGHFTEHPVFNQTLNFDVLSKEGRLQVSLWDAQLGADRELGHVTVDVHSLKAGEAVKQTLDLQGKGAVTLELALTMAEGNALPETDDSVKLAHLTAIQGAFNKIKDHAMEVAQQLAAGPEAQFGYARYDRSPQLPEVPLEELPRCVAGLPPSQVLAPEKLARMGKRGIEYLYSQVEFIKRSEANPEDPYLAYFGGWIEENKRLVEHWKDDDELARQFTQGVCPMVLSLLSSPDQVPVSMRELELGGSSIADLVKKKRLFLLDYKALAPLKNYRNMFLYAPLALVYKKPKGDGLTVGAIQLERKTGAAVYTADKTPQNRWLFAKMHLACADNQYHQWLFHLGYGHLAMEPFVVAFHNALPKEHRLHKLLLPHFHDTIGINFLARQTLVSDVAPFTDRTFSTGTAQALQMFLGEWKEYDFFSQAFPAQLAARGFDEAKSDGLEEYWYREDGFQLWNAIGKYVTGVVEATYAGDGAVVGDNALQAWAKESTDPERADIPGFPSVFESRDTLVRTLQTLIWAVSAHHSAVNFSQFDYLSYVPNRPDSLFAPMPEGEGEIELKQVYDALPPPNVSHFQISFAWMLSAPSEHTLRDVDAMAKELPEVHKAFQADLSRISESIHARNGKLRAAGKADYPYLLPERVAASIAI